MSANNDDVTGGLSTSDSSLVNDSELRKPDGTLYEQEFWSIHRHELIAGAAEEFVKDAAWKQINRILGPLGGLTLSDIAGWADRVKRRGPRADDDQETKDFLSVQRNRTNDRWHYVNLPLDTDEYSREKYPTLTREDDVVQIIRECVLVLKGKLDSFSEVNALRLLVHLVGDVHQPVHVGCCYIDESGDLARLVTDPDEVAANLDTYETDQGGNKIILPVGTSGASIHSYWDSRLGGNTPDLSDAPHEGGDAEADSASDEGSASDPELQQRTVLKLRALIKKEGVLPTTPGEGEADVSRPEDWAVDWANDSLAAARDAYASEVDASGEYVRFEITGKREDGNFDVEWAGRDEYDARCKPIVIDRMKQAAANLAALLNAIWH